MHGWQLTCDTHAFCASVSHTCTQVFPGGALDAADRASAAALLGSGINGSGRTVHLREGEAPPEAVIRTAACREAFEEAGLPLVAPQPSVEAWARACAEWRSRVHRDASE